MPYHFWRVWIDFMTHFPPIQRERLWVWMVKMLYMYHEHTIQSDFCVSCNMISRHIGVWTIHVNDRHQTCYWRWVGRNQLVASQLYSLTIHYHCTRKVAHSHRPGNSNRLRLDNTGAWAIEVYPSLLCNRFFFREHSLLNFQYKSIIFSGPVQKVQMQGIMSQIFYLRPSSNFMTKNGKI